MNPLNSMSNWFAAQELPTHLELAIVPGLGILLGYWVWSAFLKREADGGKPWLKWLGMIPLLASLVMGFMHFMRTFDDFYTSQAGFGGRLAQLHYVTFILPILGIVGLIVWNVLHARANTDY